jgi:hypothetical protein
MSAGYEHLGVYSDWVATAAGPRARATRPGREEVRRLASKILAVPSPSRDPGGVRVERRWSGGGLEGEEISYSAGYRPRTRAWVLKPAGSPVLARN